MTLVFLVCSVIWSLKGSLIIRDDAKKLSKNNINFFHEVQPNPLKTSCSFCNDYVLLVLLILPKNNLTCLDWIGAEVESIVKRCPNVHCHIGGGGMRANTETSRSSDGAGASTTMSINPEQKSPLIEWADNINRNHRILFPLI